MRPIAEGLFTHEVPPRLVGGRDLASGRIVFPCPPGSQFEPWPLSRRGRLWSFTVQRYRPKSPPYAGPADFTPFAVGYVELPGETIVEARIVDIPFEDMRIGMPLELTQVVLDPDAADPVLIHAFGPLTGEQP